MIVFTRMMFGLDRWVGHRNRLCLPEGALFRVRILLLRTGRSACSLLIVLGFDWNCTFCSTFGEVQRRSSCCDVGHERGLPVNFGGTLNVGLQFRSVILED